MNNETFDRFYNEFKDWSKEDILKRTYNIILDDVDKTRQIEQLENIRKEAIEYVNDNSLYEEEYDYDYEENIYLTGIDDEQAKKDLLNILNKGEKK